MLTCGLSLLKTSFAESAGEALSGRNDCSSKDDRDDDPERERKEVMKAKVEAIATRRGKATF
jgi:hypothetical protein